MNSEAISIATHSAMEPTALHAYDFRVGGCAVFVLMKSLRAAPWHEWLLAEIRCLDPAARSRLPAPLPGSNPGKAHEAVRNFQQCPRASRARRRAYFPRWRRASTISANAGEAWRRLG